MKTEAELSLISQIRALKEENAAEHGYSLESIIAAARLRQESSGRRIIRCGSSEAAETESGSEDPKDERR